MRTFALTSNELAAVRVCLIVDKAVLRLPWLLAGSVVLIAAASDYSSVQRKFQTIENGSLRRGSRVDLTMSELNAYAAHEVPMVTGGVRQPKLTVLRPEVAQATAL